MVAHEERGDGNRRWVKSVRCILFSSQLIFCFWGGGCNFVGLAAGLVLGLTVQVGFVVSVECIFSS